MTEQKTSQAITLTLNKDSGEVTAAFAPVEGADLVTNDTLEKLLTEHHYEHFFQTKENTKAFIEKCQTENKPFSMVIAKRKDGEFSLQMTEDKMELTLSLIPPYGGKPKTVEIIKAIQELGVKHGLKHAELRGAIKTGFCKNVLIAEGTWPELGQAVTFHSYLDDLDKELAEVDENAFMKYSDIGHLLLVNPGDKLMRRIPPVPGKDGVDILGNNVPTKPVADMNFNSACTGTRIDENDPNLLLADIPGQPKIISNGIKINNIIEIENIDLSTGNLDFQGTIHIKGDVKSGMKLHSTGDIFVNGMIEAAEVIAGGNVSVKGGAIGASDIQSGVTSAGAPPACIISKTGTVQVLFAQNIKISADKAVLITGNSTQCDLSAGTEIIVGKPKSMRNGQIIGGITQATKLVKAVSFGSNTGVQTKIQVGDDPSWADKVMEQEKAISHKTAELEYTIKQLNKLKQDKKANPDAVKDEAISEKNTARQQLSEEVRKMNAELAALKEGHVALEEVSVVAQAEMYEGVEIRIGKYRWAATSDMGKGMARLVGDKVVFSK